MSFVDCLKHYLRKPEQSDIKIVLIDVSPWTSEEHDLIKVVKVFKQILVKKFKCEVIVLWPYQNHAFLADKVPFSQLKVTIVDSYENPDLTVKNVDDVNKFIP